MTRDGLSSTGVVTPTAPRFAWLSEPKGRRAALARVEQAVRQGWDIDEAGRLELVRGLEAMLGGGGLSGRELARVGRIVVAMDAANAAAGSGALPDHS